MIHEEEMAERDKEGSGAIDNVADYRKRVALSKSLRAY